jgi:predicted dehydrogenase
MRIGTLGTANITLGALLEPALEVADVEVAAVAARDVKRAEDFARRHDIPTVHDTYEALLADDSLDAIYNPLVPSLHAKWSINALRAGKHVLCEKPFARNAIEAQGMVAAGRRAGLVLMEAFHWRYHPLAEAMISVVAELGDLEHGEAVFAASISNKASFLYDYSLGGGATMDLGCYPVHWLRTLTGEEPRVINATAVEDGGGVDLALSADLLFPSGFRATVRCSMVESAGMVRYIVINGSKGHLRVVNPMSPQSGHRLTVEFADGRRRDETFTLRSTYVFQLEAFRDAVENSRQPPTGGDDAIANMVAIDSLYRSAGLPLR